MPESFAGGPLDEMSLTKQDYAAAKRDAEDAIVNLGKDGFSVSIARCFAFVGPYLPRDKHFAIGNFIEDGLNNRPIQVKADHPVYRSYMYADDLVEWLMQIAHSSNSDCPVFNVGSDEALEIREVAKKVADTFSVPLACADIGKPTIDRYIPSIEKGAMHCALKLKFNLQDALEKTVSAIQGLS
jgi:dTDP-glucose 4,6-dehydratase